MQGACWNLNIRISTHRYVKRKNVSQSLNMRSKSRLEHHMQEKMGSQSHMRTHGMMDGTMQFLLFKRVVG